jgi:hypothetical protein
MQHMTGIPRNQLFFSSLEDTILSENPVRFIDALPCIFCPNVLLRQFALWLGCKNTTLRFFEQYLETSKAQTFAREIESKSTRKSREETFFAQISLLQNRQFA